VNNNYLNLGMNKSGFVHTLPSGGLTCGPPDFPMKFDFRYVKLDG
jgi:hypothetical protein